MATTSSDSTSEVVDTSGLGPVQETMLITLWARAAESRRPDAIVLDPEAERLVRHIDYDFERFAGCWKSQVGVAVRTRHLDDAVRAFLRRHPDALVVNLGAGLDTRFHRVDDGRVIWADVDVPDAIALRKRLLRPSERNPCWTCSALDPTWIERAQGLGRRTLIIAEGVVMFLPRAQVEAMIDAVASALPGAEMLFDCIGPLMVRFPWLHDSLPRTRARFVWGLREPERTLGTRAVVREARPMLDERPRRWRWMRWLRAVPAMRRQFVVVRLVFPPAAGGGSTASPRGLEDGSLGFGGES